MSRYYPPVMRASLLALPLLFTGCSDGDSQPSAAHSATPITSADGIWEYVSFADTACGNGEPYGLAINRNSQSSKVLIFMDGGGWCWNGSSCQPGQFNITDFTFTGLNEAQVLTMVTEDKGGILDRDEEENPFHDYNLVFLPYCSGDMHFGTAGLAADGVVHQGALNVAAFLKRLVPTFADAEQVVLTGVSAGAFGALLNFDQVQQAFGTIPVSLLADSAPPLPSGVIAADLTEALWQAWQPAFPDDCSYCRDFYSWWQYLERKYPQQRKAFVASGEDWLLRRLWGMNVDGSAGEAMSEDRYHAALMTMAAAAASSPASRMFIDDGDQHVFNDKSLLFLTTAAGEPLSGWLDRFANGDEGWANAIDSRRDDDAGGPPLLGGVSHADAVGDEAYTYPLDPSFGAQQDLRALTLSNGGERLQLQFRLAEVTSSWSPVNGFDHLSLSIYFEVPGSVGVTAMPEAFATVPEGFSWRYFHRLYGWGNQLYVSDGAAADQRGTPLEARPAVTVDQAAATISISYAAADLGLASWEGVRIYVTSWDIDGISDSYRPLAPVAEPFVYGGGGSDQPRVMDAIGPLAVPAAPEQLSDAPADERYQYPTDGSYGRQQDLLGAAWVSGEDGLTLQLQLAEISNGWNPVNGFDHVAFTLFISQPGQPGVAELPFLNASMPDGLLWQRMVRLYGWGNQAFNTQGADADHYGELLATTAAVAVDAEAGTLTVTLPSSLLEPGTSYEGAQLYLTTWDIDGISDSYRPLAAEAGQWQFGGGDSSDPRIMDELLIQIAPSP